MKSRILLICLWVVGSVFTSFALDIPTGTYYYDNALTKFSQVRFVYGNGTSCMVLNLTMPASGGYICSLSIPAKVSNTYRYFFTDAPLSAGYCSKAFNTLKDELTNAGYKRTATTDKAMTPGYIFVPDMYLNAQPLTNWFQGEWEKLPTTTPCTAASHTLPIMYLNTEGGVDIKDRDTYIAATIYIDASHAPGFESFGSASNPVSGKVKGRGNWTWTGFEKKPYLLKLSSKAEPLGLSKGKGFCLLAHADDDAVFMRNTVGFKLSELVGLAWTPKQVPVELYKNGEYWGIYFLTDKLDVSKHRVNITEQEDLETDPEKVSGGWLVEIDNYDTDPHVTVDEYTYQEWDAKASKYVTKTKQIIFTYKSPEELSDVQNSTLKNMLQTTNNALYEYEILPTSTTWEKYIDVPTAAKFYVIQEVMGNAESFHGSCYLYRDQGTEQKWYFGPVWDFGNSFRYSNEDGFIYHNPPFGDVWIKEMAKYPVFQHEVRKVWNQLYWEILGNNSRLEQCIDSVAKLIASPRSCDCDRWGDKGYDGCEYGLQQATQRVKNYLSQRIQWLNEQWDAQSSSAIVEADGITASIYPNPTNGYVYVEAGEEIFSVELYDMEGQLCQAFPRITHWPLALQVGAGAYVLQLHTAHGVQRQKLLVK